MHTHPSWVVCNVRTLCEDYDARALASAPASSGRLLLRLRRRPGVDGAVLEERQGDLEGLAQPFAQLLVALHLLVRADRALFVLLGRCLRVRELLAQIVALLAQQVLLAGERSDVLPRGGQLALELLGRGRESVGALLQRLGRGVALRRLFVELLRLLLERALLLLQLVELLVPVLQLLSDLRDALVRAGAPAGLGPGRGSARRPRRCLRRRRRDRLQLGEGGFLVEAEKLFVGGSGQLGRLATPLLGVRIGGDPQPGFLDRDRSRSTRGLQRVE